MGSESVAVVDILKNQKTLEALSKIVLKFSI